MPENQSKHQPPLRVMQMISNLDIGGAQEVVRTLSAYLVDAGTPALVCTLKDGPLRQEIERLGISVEVLPGRRYSILAFPLFVLDMWRLRQALLRLVEKYQVNVIQTHLLRSLDFLVLSLKLGPKPPLVFWTIHNFNFALRAENLPRFRWLLGPKRFAHRLLYLLTARWVNGIVAVSAEVETAILKTIGPVRDRITVICNGVDVRRYPKTVDRAAVRGRLNLPEDASLLLVVGTLKTQKGHRYLIEAVAPVIAQCPHVHVLFAGDGDLRDELQNQVSSAGLQEHIHFLGNRSDIPELLSASDYFILPSLWEGLPMALIEAMASELPIIATQVSGNSQVMVSGETGLLVPAADVRQLREAIFALLGDPVRAKRMGKMARARVEKEFSAQIQAREHITLYEKEWRSANRNGK